MQYVYSYSLNAKDEIISRKFKVIYENSKYVYVLESGDFGLTQLSHVDILRQKDGMEEIRKSLIHVKTGRRSRIFVDVKLDMEISEREKALNAVEVARKKVIESQKRVDKSSKDIDYANRLFASNSMELATNETILENCLKKLEEFD